MSETHTDLHPKASVKIEITRTYAEHGWSTIHIGDFRLTVHHHDLEVPKVTVDGREVGK
jgi:hypothetical protein